MKVEIDQSGKIEQTELNTVIALSNKVKFAILLDKQTKRILQKIFREKKQPRIFIYQTFSALIAIILSEIKPKTKVIIDNEYLNHKQELKKQIKFYIKQLNQTNINFEFGFIGKKSNAHALAAKVANKKVKANKLIKLKEIAHILWP